MSGDLRHLPLPLYLKRIDAARAELAKQRERSLVRRARAELGRVLRFVLVVPRPGVSRG